MNENSVLRLSLITGSGQSTSFKTNLRKIVSVVIFDNQNNPMTIDEIVLKIKDDYELIFTDREILNSINSSKNIFENINEHIIIDKCETNISKYKLTINSYQKLNKNNQNLDLEKIVAKFLNKNPIFDDYKSNGINLCELLRHFLYNTFNSNKQILMSLINKEYSPVEFLDFSNDEKKIINAFLNWEDAEKDKFVFDTISYCVDYCMLTLKKESSFKELFSGKNFYLDANVIFRLAGFNNEERQTVVEAFINKCLENKIHILYTNFTYQEIINTINNYVYGIQQENKICGKPLKSDYYKIFTPIQRNYDFRMLYNSWCSLGNKYNNYDSFRRFLMKKIHKVLDRFKKIDNLSNSKLLERNEYEKYSNSLKDYKNEHRAYFTDYSISVDVNNCMFLINLRNKEKGLSMYDIKNYFISADGNLCNWSKDLIPGQAPFCVLPSIWYALLLKYSSRTENDSRAFNLFLNLRYRISHNDIYAKKERIFDMVMSLSESVEIKELILDDIINNIQNIDYLETLSADSIVNNSKQSVLNKKIEDFKTLYKESESKNLLEAGKMQGYREIAEIHAKKIFNRRNILFHIISFIPVFLFLVSILVVLYTVFTGGIKDFLMQFTSNKYSLTIQGVVAIASFCTGTLTVFFINPIKEFLKRDTLETLIEKQFQKLVSKSQNQNN